MSRRFGTRRGARATGGLLRASLDLGVVGTFTRSGEGSYLTGAATDGESAFLAWAAGNTRRFENRGDGAGGLLLLERASTNLFKHSRQITETGSWTLVGFGTHTCTADAGTGPDGTSVADRIEVTGASFCRGQNATSATDPHTVSAWGRAFSGTSIWAGNYASGTAWNVASASTTWQRQSVLRAGAASAYYPGDASLPSATPQDTLVDLHQAEAGRYPTSAIRTTTATVTRGADTLTIGQASVPGALFTKSFQVDQVSPIFANTGLVSGDVRWLFTIGGANDGVRIRHDGSNVLVEAVAGGEVKAASAAQTFARHALLGAVRWDPGAGLVYVAGTAGPAGTAWSWSVGDVRIGGIQGGSGSELDARVSRIWRQV